MIVLRSLMSPVAAALAAAMFATVALPPLAQARVIATEDVAGPTLAAAAAAQEARASLLGVIAREDVQARLRSLGVEPGEAAARVRALSDAEAVAAAQRLPTDPAGQDAAGALIGAALVIFLVLLVTDLLGLTDIFPFTRNAR